MLSGRFENCYGIKEFDMPNIDFRSCNKALIYAPNGVMKSSLSQVFEDISHGKASTDRIFKNVVTGYSITHYASTYTFSSSNNNPIPQTDKIYVVNSFADSFEFTKETVATLLADETTRNSYNLLMEEMSGEIRQITDRLRELTGLSKSILKSTIVDDLGLNATSDWTDIFEKVNELMVQKQDYSFLNDCKYSELFNEKTQQVYSKPDFISHIETYISELNALLVDNPILNNKFTDHSAEVLGKALTDNNIFEAQHTIHLKDGTTVIHSIDEWNIAVQQQFDRIYSAPALSTIFGKLKALLSKNAQVVKLRDIIASHREIIPLLSQIESLKKQTWLYCFSNLSSPFIDYYNHISQYTQRIKSLYEQATAQSQRWSDVVDEFNRRFRVPFKVEIKNKANFILKDEAPNLEFNYTRGATGRENIAQLSKEELMYTLSTGEKRALYLLYILFDLERIRQQAASGAGQFLIVADDIADSFDYKNKYAIIEYLNDLADTQGIDLLILTHNFDFYRTIKSRLGVKRSHALVAQRDEDGKVTLTVFKYQKDFFKNVVIENIHNGQIDSDEKKKMLISSIPFYRNVCEYIGNDTDKLKLTCCLHLKTAPLNTENIMLSDVWRIIEPFLDNTPFSGNDEKFMDAVERISDRCCSDTVNEVLLENKLVVSIAIRLLTEKFLRQTLINNGQQCVDSESNQTREWYNCAKQYLNPNQKNVIDEVNIITPENIHINAFMFEPLIDISDWALRKLYYEVKSLGGGAN